MKLLLATILSSALLGTVSPAVDGNPAAADEMRLQALPTHVYKTADPGNERTESWTIWLFIETASERDLAVQDATIQLMSGERRIRSTHYDAEGVHALTIVPPFPARLPDGKESSNPIFWPLAIRIRNTEAAAAKVDSMRVELSIVEAGKRKVASVILPVETYRQKTDLIYPFKGKGIVTNAGVTNGGHRNRSGQFAIDGVGLDDNYGVYLVNGGRKSTDYAGWGRAIMAPAAGVIVEATADRPDQPDPEKSDPKYYAPGFPNGGDPGNHVVIDHGNGEFSMLAHFQAGSLRVKRGDHVKQGQVLGKLGSSGDTVTPHLHYQLQSGPDPVWSDGLPFKFSNIDQSFLVRGTYFEAR